MFNTYIKFGFAIIALIMTVTSGYYVLFAGDFLKAIYFLLIAMFITK